jgi:hypothetical protein
MRLGDLATGDVVTVNSPTHQFTNLPILPVTSRAAGARV